MRCKHCGNEMIWGCDYMASDLWEDIEEDYIISSYYCSNCDKTYEVSEFENNDEEEIRIV